MDSETEFQLCSLTFSVAAFGQQSLINHVLKTWRKQGGALIAAVMP